MTRRLRLLVPALACALVAVLAPAADAADTTVTIVLADKVYPAQTTVTAIVQVSNGNGATVFVGQKIADKVYPLNCGGSPVYDDTFDCDVYLIYNTRIFVTVNDTIAATQDVRVRPVIETALRTGHIVSGKYAVMAAGTEPKFVSASTPGIEGQMCLRHEVQRYRDGAWRTVVTTGCRTEQAKGRVTWTWTGSHPRNVSFRVRATFPGNALNAPGPGRWLYFRFR